MKDSARVQVVARLFQGSVAPSFSTVEAVRGRACTAARTICGQVVSAVVAAGSFLKTDGEAVLIGEVALKLCSRALANAS